MADDPRIFNKDTITYTAKNQGKHMSQNIVMKKTGSDAPFFSVDTPDSTLETPKRIITARKEGGQTNVYIDPDLISDEMKAELAGAATETIDGKTYYKIENVTSKFKLSNKNGNEYSFDCTIGGSSVTITANCSELSINGKTQTLPEGDDTKTEKGYGFTLSQEILEDWVKGTGDLEYEGGDEGIKSLPTPILQALGAFYATDCRNNRKAKEKTIGDFTFFGLDAMEGLDSNGVSEHNSVLFVKTSDGNHYVYDKSSYHKIVPGGKKVSIGMTESESSNDFNVFLSYHVGTRRIDFPIKLKRDTTTGKVDLSDVNTQRFIKMIEFLTGATVTDWDGDITQIKIGEDEFIEVKTDATRPEKIDESGTRKVNHRPRSTFSTSISSAAYVSGGGGGGGGDTSRWIPPVETPVAGLALDPNIKVDVNPLDINGNNLLDVSGNPITEHTETTYKADGSALLAKFKRKDQTRAMVEVEADSADPDKTQVTLRKNQLSTEVQAILVSAGYAVVSGGKFVLTDAQVKITATGMTVSVGSGANHLEIEVTPKTVSVLKGPAGAPTENAKMVLTETQIVEPTIYEKALHHPTTKYDIGGADYDDTTPLTDLPREVVYGLAASAVSSKNPAVTGTNGLSVFAANNIPGFKAKSGADVNSNLIVCSKNISGTQHYYLFVDGNLVEFDPAKVKISYEGNGGANPDDANLSHTIITFEEPSGETHQVVAYTPVDIDADGKVTYLDSDGLKLIRAFKAYMDNPSLSQADLTNAARGSGAVALGNDPLERAFDGKITKPDATFSVDGVDFSGRAEVDTSEVVVAGDHDVEVDVNVGDRWKPGPETSVAGLTLNPDIALKVTQKDINGNIIKDDAGNDKIENTSVNFAMNDTAHPNNIAEFGIAGQPALISAEDGDITNPDKKTTVSLDESQLSDEMKALLTAAGVPVVGGKYMLENAEVKLTSTGMAVAVDVGANHLEIGVTPKGIAAQSGPIASPFVPASSTRMQLDDGKCLKPTLYEKAFHHDTTKYQYVDGAGNLQTYDYVTTPLTDLPKEVVYGLAASAAAGNNPAVELGAGGFTLFAANDIPGFKAQDGTEVKSNIVIGNDTASGKFYIFIGGDLVEFNPADVTISYEGNGGANPEDANLSHTVITIKDSSGNLHQAVVHTPVDIAPDGKVTYQDSPGLRVVRAFNKYLSNPNASQTDIDTAAAGSGAVALGSDPLNRDPDGTIINPNATFAVDGVNVSDGAVVDPSIVVTADAPALSTDVTMYAEVRNEYAADDFPASFEMDVTTTTLKGDAVVDADGNSVVYKTRTTITKNDSTHADDLVHITAGESGVDALSAKVVDVGGKKSISVTLSEDVLSPATVRSLIDAGADYDPVTKLITIKNATLTFTESGVNVSAIVTKGAASQQFEIKADPRGIVVEKGDVPAAGAKFTPSSTSVALTGGPLAAPGADTNKICFNRTIYKRAFDFDRSQINFQYDDKGTVKNFTGPEIRIYAQDGTELAGPTYVEGGITKNSVVRYFKADGTEVDEPTYLDPDGKVQTSMVRIYKDDGTTLIAGETYLDGGVLKPTKALVTKNGTAFAAIPPAVAYALAAQGAPEKGEKAGRFNYKGIVFATVRLTGIDGTSVNVVLARDTNDSNKRYILDNGEWVELDGPAEYGCVGDDPSKIIASVKGKNGKQYQLPAQQELADPKHFDTTKNAHSDLVTIADMIEERKPGAVVPVFTDEIKKDSTDGTYKIGDVKLKKQTLNAENVPKNVPPKPPKVENIADYGSTPVKPKKKKKEEEEEAESSSSGGDYSYKPYKVDDDAVKAAQQAGGAGVAAGLLLAVLGIFLPGIGTAVTIAGLALAAAGGATFIGASFAPGIIGNIELGGPFGKIAKARRAVSKREKMAQKYLDYSAQIEAENEHAERIEAEIGSTDVKAAKKLRKHAAKLEKKQEKMLMRGGPKLIKKLADKKAAAERANYAADHPDASEEDLEAQELAGRKDFILQCAEKEPGSDRWTISKEGYAIARSILANMTEAEAARYLESISPEEREIVKQAISDVRDAACDMLRAYNNTDRTLTPKQIKERLGENGYDYIRRCRGISKDNAAGLRVRRGKNASINRMMDNIFGTQTGSVDWVHDYIYNGTNNVSVTPNVQRYVRDGGILDQLDTMSYASAELDDIYSSSLDEKTGIAEVKDRDGNVVIYTKEQLDAARAQVGYQQARLRNAMTAQGNARRSLITQLRDTFNADVQAALDPADPNYNTPGSRMIRRMGIRAAGTAGEEYEAEASAADFGYTTDEFGNRISVSEQQYRRIRAGHNEVENNIGEYSDIAPTVTPPPPPRVSDTPAEHGH